jgi:hypothetical protein
MKNLRILIGICILFLAGLVWWIWADSSKSNPTQEISKIEKKIRPDIEARPDEGNLLVLEDEGIKKPEGMTQADWERALRVHAIKKSANRNVNFFGKVVDQYGDPVEGVQLELVILSYQDSFIDYLKSGREQIKNKLSMTTDANGMFSVEKKKGTSFKIERMTKEGYSTPDRGVQTYFVYNNLSSGKTSSMYHSSDKSQPVVYHLWKKGETEPLIKQGVQLLIEPAKGITEMYYPLVLNGNASPQPMLGWDIKLTGKNIPSPDPKKQHEDYWEVTMTAGDGGGLQLTDSPHANLAPENGYQTSLTIKSTDQQYPRENIVRRVYYRDKYGKKYAAFRVEFGFGSIKDEGAFYVTLADMRINPNGSRNLEYDPSKRIK